jgi:hypothetical protein
MVGATPDAAHHCNELAAVLSPEPVIDELVSLWLHRPLAPVDSRPRQNDTMCSLLA